MATSQLQLFEKEPNQLSLNPEQNLFKAGDAADGKMYVLLKGQAEVIVDDVMVELAEPGAILGEMALIDPGARSATVTCTQACQLAVIDEKRFRALIQDTPFFAIEVMKVLARRLRKTDSML